MPFLPPRARPARRALLALVALAALGACDHSALITDPGVAMRPSAGDAGEFAAGHRSTMAELMANPVLIELQRHPATGRSAQGIASAPRGRSNAVTGAGTTNFLEFERFSVERNDWLVADGDSAFFRDLTFAVVQDIQGASNGDTWQMQATLPDGSLFDYPVVTFYSSYNGASDCFVVTSSNFVCGSNNVTLYDVKQIQCGQTGKWKFTMKFNVGTYDQREAKIVSRIDENVLPMLAQGTFPWGPQLYAHACPTTYVNAAGVTKTKSIICDDTHVPHYTIHQKGCALTSAAMVIGYHEGLADPGTINTWLRDNDGYVVASIDFTKAASFGAANGATDLSFIGGPTYRNNTDVTTLKGLLCKYGPQVIAVKGTSHFVMATGYDEDNHTVTIHDPAGGIARDLRYYGNTFNGMRPFSGQERTVTFFSQLTITFHSPVEAVITDPSGRRTGLDPRTGAVYAEIPGSYADSTFSDDDDDPSAPVDESVKELHVETPMAGTYTVTVVGTDVGTYTAAFRLNGNARDASASQVLTDVPTSPGEVHSYQFNYDPTSSAPVVSLQGGFKGGGQNGEVDEFLTYTAPTTKTSSLPAGTTSTRVTIIYGATIDPATFHATLEGADVTSAFHPAPGTRESVTLPLVSGRNVLKLGVTGRKGTHSANDQDQLVFIVN